MTSIRRLAALLLIIGGPARASAHAQDAIAVISEPGTPVIATELLLPAGPADEPDGRAGIAHLAARTVVRPILPTLDSLGAHLTITPYKDAIGFTLIAAPDAWNAAIRTLLVAVFRDPLDPGALSMERRAILAELLARRDNPADASARAVDAAVFGEDHPWGRPTVGDAATVAAITHAEADAFLRASFRPERAHFAVVGPVDEPSVRAQIRPYLVAEGAGEPPVEIPPRSPRPEPVLRDYNSVTTWVTASFAFPPGADVEALRMLAHLVADEIAFDPTRRSVYDSKAEVVERVDGGEARFTVVVPPEEAAAWALRITELVEGIPAGAFFEETWEGRLRRYRGARLHELSAPEDRAAALARAMLVSGRQTQSLPPIDELSVDRVRRAAIALEDPTVILLGPFLDDAD